MSEFWFNDPRVLFKDIDKFYPSYEMNLVEKLNAIMKLSIYIGIVLALIGRNYLYLYIPIGIGIFTLFIFKMQRENIEKFFEEYDRMECDEGKPCVKPTVNNPFMNFNYITDDRYRPPACKSFDNKEIRDEIEDKFNHNLYRDVGDLYGKNNSQRQFYTMPSTQAIGDQTAFAKWCYYTGPTCKEDTIKCAPEWSPIETNQIFERFVNN